MPMSEFVHSIDPSPHGAAHPNATHALPLAGLLLALLIGAGGA